jgi:putative acetyltransferase
MERGVRLQLARAEDAEAMLIVHRAAVRGMAAHFYDPETIEDWGSPIRAEYVEGLAQRIMCGEEEAVVARDASGHVIGFGSIVPSAHELRGLYVAPEHGRSGIGGMILQELEARAQERGVDELSVDASVNAEAFYRRHGFEVEGRGQHALPSGRQIDCVHLRKQLSMA